ncbi:hypothetical protein A6770_00655 [Nostoc minutum NIES-26]|uniref:Uncharacterized protein n=1 Tax=Nostoc minutum NIES-26 TaxID=1844469 RepID=A0A367R0H1_9NOSO|nr:hypothetical protein A6770_00655 [Nostoc minutum NIES-26]
MANNESDIPLKLEELEPFQVRNKASIPQYNQFISVGLIAAIITILLITMGLFLKFSFGNKELQKNNRNNASFLNSSLKLEF